MRKAYTVKCAWDAEARVWHVQETNVPGLATESATVEAMTRKLRSLIPELLALNEGAAAVDVPVELLRRKPRSPAAGLTRVCDGGAAPRGMPRKIRQRG